VQCPRRQAILVTLRSSYQTTEKSQRFSHNKNEVCGEQRTVHNKYVSYTKHGRNKKYTENFGDKISYKKGHLEYFRKLTHNIDRDLGEVACKDVN
jgi:hypothetical protein